MCLISLSCPPALSIIIRPHRSRWGLLLQMEYRGLSVTIMSPEKTTKLIMMPFGGQQTLVGSRNHLLDGGPEPPCKGAIFRGKWRSTVKYGIVWREPRKTAEPIDMPFGVWTVKYNIAQPWAVQKWLYRSRCSLGCWAGTSKEPCIKWGAYCF